MELRTYYENFDNCMNRLQVLILILNEFKQNGI